MTSHIVFIKLVSSGEYEQRVLEAAYVIYDTKSGATASNKSIIHHSASHPVHDDSYAYKHCESVQGQPPLLELCADKAKSTTMEAFCKQFTADLKVIPRPKNNRITFVGDHIFQTRTLLMGFMFRANAWIQFNGFTPFVEFKEFTAFMQPFELLNTSVGRKWELPRPVFRAGMDVERSYLLFQLALNQFKHANNEEGEMKDETKDEIKEKPGVQVLFCNNGDYHAQSCNGSECNGCVNLCYNEGA